MHFLHYKHAVYGEGYPSEKHPTYKTIADEVNVAPVYIISISGRYVLLVNKINDKFVIASDINKTFYHTDIPNDLIDVINLYNAMIEF